jgi:hypothetical protein
MSPTIRDGPERLDWLVSFMDRQATLHSVQSQHGGSERERAYQEGLGEGWRLGADAVREEARTQRDLLRRRPGLFSRLASWLW